MRTPDSRVPPDWQTHEYGVNERISDQTWDFAAHLGQFRLNCHGNLLFVRENLLARDIGEHPPEEPQEDTEVHHRSASPESALWWAPLWMSGFSILRIQSGGFSNFKTQWIRRRMDWKASGKLVESAS